MLEKKLFIVKPSQQIKKNVLLLYNYYIHNLWPVQLRFQILLNIYKYIYARDYKNTSLTANMGGNQ